MRLLKLCVPLKLAFINILLESNPLSRWIFLADAAVGWGVTPNTDRTARCLSRASLPMLRLRHPTSKTYRMAASLDSYIAWLHKFLHAGLDAATEARLRAAAFDIGGQDQ